MNIRSLIVIVSLILLSPLFAQGQGLIQGMVSEGREAVPFASIVLQPLDRRAVSDSSGHFLIENVPPGNYILEASSSGLEQAVREITISDSGSLTVNFNLHQQESSRELEGVVVTGTMKEVSKRNSPVPVEVYTSQFFKANPTPTLFDALQNINGVRPQLNCNICNTGDIHINGLEGPYTMILIDGMPLVSGLATVYGLSGIPQSLIDRIEVVKGPASTLYGSEAVGGLINVITKRPDNAPLVSADVFTTTWGEVNADFSAKLKAGKKAQSLLGLSYFNYTQPIDNNNDNFTDVTLQNRISIFNKWSFDRKAGRIFSLAARYVKEDRWGGEMNWNKSFRGGDQVYGESIYTDRWELFGQYQLPTKEHFMLQFSANKHDQNSAYGDMLYLADQRIAFTQLTWSKNLAKHDLLAGLTYRYTYYDDNTPATAAAENININQAANTHLPGLFLQDEVRFDENNTLLIGARFDHNSLHGNIFTPRVNYKWNSKNKLNILRLGFGNGYRVANVFTEDHAALTGARQLVFVNALKPERSWNGNLNFVKKIIMDKGYINLDATAFYTYFTNKIIPDYDSDANKIIYDNLEGFAVSSGFALNVDLALDNGLKLIAGATLMDVYNVGSGVRSRQLFAERFTGTWTVGYTFQRIGLTLDYTGNIYGPMRLPLLSETDPRKEYSPWWSIQNIQLTKKLGKRYEIYGGVKNLLNWTPDKGNPFIIARAHDPFDKNVIFDAQGQVVPTQENPYGLTFDPSYMYGPNQGRRGFLGLRFNLR